MADKEFDPSKPSTVFSEQASNWQLIRDIRGGAASVRDAKARYLPKFEDEDQTEFDRRVATAPFTALYEDSTRTLCAKPFAKEVKLQGSVPPDIQAWTENVDLAGNNLHVFAANFFNEALHMGACYLLVDMPRQAEGVQTLAQEREAGARPYFRLIPADDMLAIYDGVRNGKTYIRQIRFKDNALELDDLEEIIVERVRVIDDLSETGGGITVRVFERGDDGWFLREDMSGLITAPLIKEIPLVPLLFGLEVNGRFGIKPTMMDLAHKQIEHYQHANRLNEIFNFAGFPLLQAEGMAPPTEMDAEGKMVRVKIHVGPRTILFAPPAQQGDKPKWSFIEPSANSIEQMREHLKDIESEMRMLGLQPQMPQTGIQNMAATTSAINAARTHSAVQSWALRLKDALELAFVFMARWRGLPETAECYVFTDFSAEVLRDLDEKLLFEMVQAGIISRETFYDEMSRRDILGPQFDKKTEADKIELDNVGVSGSTGFDDDSGGTEDDDELTSQGGGGLQ